MEKEILTEKEKEKIKEEIKMYQRDIEKLKKMREIYDSTETQCGQLAWDMYMEIQLQIDEFKECIKNLKKWL